MAEWPQTGTPASSSSGKLHTHRQKSKIATSKSARAVADGTPKTRERRGARQHQVKRRQREKRNPAGSAEGGPAGGGSAASAGRRKTHHGLSTAAQIGWQGRCWCSRRAQQQKGPYTPGRRGEEGNHQTRKRQFLTTRPTNASFVKNFLSKLSSFISFTSASQPILPCDYLLPCSAVFPSILDRCSRSALCSCLPLLYLAPQGWMGSST